LLAILYDIHGNLPALDAVLENARGAGAGSYLLGGDYALFGPWPRETVERLRELDADWIRGNGERWTAHPGDAPQDEIVQGAITACATELGDALVAELAALPFDAARDGVRYVHASPVSDVRSFGPDHDDAEEEMLAGVLETRLVFGHTHLAFRRQAGAGVELFNPGSVGMPFDGDHRAAYALLDDGGAIDHRRVDYDHERSAAAVRERFSGPFAEKVAERIERARFVA
jgi:diadenosine tetraphosphatase ApaH/serine/threonine PP2A family protein phosphatase